MRLVTFVRGPFNGEIRHANLPSCNHYGQVITINAFLFQDLNPEGYWTHTLAEYDICGDKAIFNKLVTEYHSHRYRTGNCKCDEPGF